MFDWYHNLISEFVSIYTKPKIETSYADEMYKNAFIGLHILFIFAISVIFLYFLEPKLHKYLTKINRQSNVKRFIKTLKVKNKGNNKNV